MPLESVLTVATLAVVLWVVGVLLPRAVKERNWFSLLCAILCVALAVIAWFLFGSKGVRS